MADPRKSSRRDFLRGRAAVDRMLDAADGPQTGSESTENCETSQPNTGVTELHALDEKAGYLIHVARKAMACQFQVFFNAGQYPNDTIAALESLDEVERLEAQLSVYREESEISVLNRTAAERCVTVEMGLFSLFRLAGQIHTASNSAFDITAGPLSRAWGFFRRAGEVPTTEALKAARANVGWHNVTLDEQDLTVTFTNPGVELNVNSLGKGYALECCARILEEQGINDFLYHGGQSSILARGKRGDHPDGWTVGIRHPLEKDEMLAEITLKDAALATSGNATQSFVYQGKRYGHIIDPRTAQPATGVYTATVVAPDAGLADALATACYVLGSKENCEPDHEARRERIVELCRHFPNVGCLIVSQGKRDNSIEITKYGLDSITNFNG